MIAHLVCAFLLVVFYILQTTIFSQITLLSGSADLVLLFLIAWSVQEQVKNTWLWTAIAGILISIISAMPLYAPLIAYMGVIGISKLLQRRIWKVPILLMFIVVLLGTFFQHTVFVVALQIMDTPISWMESLDVVILPSVILNLIFSIPIYAIANEVVGRIYPLEVDA